MVENMESGIDGFTEVGDLFADLDSLVGEFLIDSGVGEDVMERAHEVTVARVEEDMKSFSGKSIEDLRKLLRVEKGGMIGDMALLHRLRVKSKDTTWLLAYLLKNAGVIREASDDEVRAEDHGLALGSSVGYVWL